MTSIVKTITKFTQNTKVRETYFTLCFMGGCGFGISGGMCYWCDKDFNRKRIKQFDWYQIPSICFVRGVEFISYMGIGFIFGSASAAMIIPTLPVVLPVSVIFSTSVFRHEVKCIFGFK